ncbi:MAG: F0F1 ATP synthase subunit delta [Treponema sp.]|jgi:F0F1-type ATP synthase delta subunit|nr:F0F1 ATP synthase subunit delta [Treponema sp.]
MFQAERWARAFVLACEGEGGGAAESGLRMLRALEPAIGGIPGLVSGAFAARQLDRMLRAALAQARVPPEDRGPEYARRLIYLLVQKGAAGRLGELSHAIGRALEKQRGLMPVILESASHPPEDFTAALTAVLQEKTGAKGIALEIRLAPQLLGGCRVRMGSASWDASLRGMLRKMARDLDVPAFTGGAAW